MAAAAAVSRLHIVYRPDEPTQDFTGHTSIAPLLELSLAQSNSQGVYVYRFDRERDALPLVVWRGLAPSEIDVFDVQLGAAADGWYRTAASAVLLDRDAWSDWRFERFPEFMRHRFEAVASIPLVHAGETVGIANVARCHRAGYSAREADFLRSLSLPLGTLLSGGDTITRLRGEVDGLARKLADRKLLDRAKGLLQARHAWSEEDAYLFLRRSSRQQRRPMREIAREVIGHAG